MYCLSLGVLEGATDSLSAHDTHPLSGWGDQEDVHRHSLQVSNWQHSGCVFLYFGRYGY